MKRFLLLSLLALVAACDDGPAEVPPEVREARREAASRACLSAELARTAQDNVQTLETTFGGETTAGSAAGAVAAYARAFLQHATLRELAYAHRDSALNHAASPEDSLRHEEQAGQITILSPQPGTLEANVIEDYERQLAALVADEDHPCNWDLDE